MGNSCMNANLNITNSLGCTKLMQYISNPYWNDNIELFGF